MMKYVNRFMHQNYPNLGLLILRVTVGSYMLLGHGVGKMAKFSQIAPNFPDPFGIGSTLSLALAGGAEFFCSIAIILGLFTRIAALPLIITMLVAAFMAHAGDPFAKREMALLYLSCFTTIFLMGGGSYSLDSKMR